MYVRGFPSALAAHRTALPDPCCPDPPGVHGDPDVLVPVRALPAGAADGGVAAEAHRLAAEEAAHEALAGGAADAAAGLCDHRAVRVLVHVLRGHAGHHGAAERPAGHRGTDRPVQFLPAVAGPAVCRGF